MVDVATVLQALAALASPLLLWLIKEVRDWKRVTDTRVDRNTEASWGSNDPHNDWPGTVELSKENRRRVDDTEERLEYVEEQRLDDVETRLDDAEERLDDVEEELETPAGGAV